MALTLSWHHAEGYVSPHAHLVITLVSIHPEVGEIRVEYSIWENPLAYEVRSEPITSGKLAIPYDDLPHTELCFALKTIDVAYVALQKHISVVKEDYINEQDS